MFSMLAAPTGAMPMVQAGAMSMVPTGAMQMVPVGPSNKFTAQMVMVYPGMAAGGYKKKKHKKKKKKKKSRSDSESESDTESEYYYIRKDSALAKHCKLNSELSVSCSYIRLTDLYLILNYDVLGSRKRLDRGGLVIRAIGRCSVHGPLRCRTTGTALDRSDLELAHAGPLGQMPDTMVYNA